MRKNKSKGKTGKKVVCPKCGYKWKTNSKRKMICCSSCKRYFNREIKKK